MSQPSAKESKFSKNEGGKADLQTVLALAVTWELAYKASRKKVISWGWHSKQYYIGEKYPWLHTESCQILQCKGGRALL